MGSLGAQGKIFISYRRLDVPGDARGVYDRLERKFGKQNVFMDLDGILVGQRFDRQLEKAISQCHVLIAIIGPRWMQSLSEHVRSGERDFVHDEIAAALKRDIVIIPVLIGHAGDIPPFPRKEDLPEDIRDLVLYQRHNIAYESFNRDADHLTAAIASVLRGGHYVVPRRTIAISGAIGLMLGAALLGYWMNMFPGIRPSPVPPIADTEKGIPQLSSDAGRAAKAADEAKKKAAEEEASGKVAEEAKRKTEADAKAADDAAKKEAADEAARKAGQQARLPAVSSSSTRLGAFERTMSSKDLKAVLEILCAGSVDLGPAGSPVRKALAAFLARNGKPSSEMITDSVWLDLQDLRLDGKRNC